MLLYAAVVKRWRLQSLLEEDYITTREMGLWCRIPTIYGLNMAVSQDTEAQHVHTSTLARTLERTLAQLTGFL